MSNGGNSNHGMQTPCVFPFKYNNRMHYQCTHEKRDGAESDSERWCCTNSNCDEDFKWGYCPKITKPLKSNCTKSGYSGIDDKNCYKLFANEVCFLHDIQTLII